ncbi:MULTISPECIES: mechanosensitive ion channel family protein [Natrialbaceae]|uniref:mechanosensitive ion channel family protein n=1 Tax=Natrialbaceae TaxID=1644061 RepID=UPI00207D3AE5|nr:mechanosensitive ion channel family protein [Natronococcus sp. CG52]
MTDPLALDWLSETFRTTPLRLAVTFVAVGVLLAVLFSFRRLQEWLNDRMGPLYSDIISTTVLVGTCLSALTVLVGVWSDTEEIRDIYAELDIGSDVVALTIFSCILVLATLIVTRVVQRVIDEVFSSASAVTAHQREVTHRLAQVTIWSVSLIVILGVWIDDLGGLLVGAGFLGIVVGMAARQTLGTVISGFVLMFARPFEIGDWIEVEDDQGIVTDISIVNTRVRSFDGEYVMIPNDVIASGVVTNRSKRGRIRVEIDVGVDYAADVERASELATSVVEDVEESLEAPSPQVISKSFGDSAVLLGVRFWIDKPSARRQAEARTAAINAIKREFEEAGIKIPFPQRELAGREETGGFRISDGRESGTTDPQESSEREERMRPQEGE